MPGTTVQNLIDLDIIFKDQQILYKKDPYLNNANAFYKAEILKKNLFDSKLVLFLKINPKNGLLFLS